MIIRTVLDLEGVARGGTAFEDDLFLLTGNGKILAARSEWKDALPGTDFFDAFHTKPSEKKELFRLMHEFGTHRHLCVPRGTRCCFSPRSTPKRSFSWRWCRANPLPFSRIHRAG